MIVIHKLNRSHTHQQHHLTDFLLRIMDILLGFFLIKNITPVLNIRKSQHVFGLNLSKINFHFWLYLKSMRGYVQRFVV